MQVVLEAALLGGSEGVVGIARSPGQTRGRVVAAVDVVVTEDDADVVVASREVLGRRGRTGLVGGYLDNRRGRGGRDIDHRGANDWRDGRHVDNDRDSRFGDGSAGSRGNLARGNLARGAARGRLNAHAAGAEHGGAVVALSHCDGDPLLDNVLNDDDLPLLKKGTGGSQDGASGGEKH